MGEKPGQQDEAAARDSQSGKAAGRESSASSVPDDVATDGSERKTSAMDDWHQQDKMQPGGGSSGQGNPAEAATINTTKSNTFREGAPGGGAGGPGLAIGDQGAVEDKQSRPPKG